MIKCLYISVLHKYINYTLTTSKKEITGLKMEMYNSDFWDKVYRENAPALMGVLRRYVTDVNIAQDLLQEVFITSIVKYDSYGGKGSFEGWMYRIAVNTALMHIRSERNKQFVADIEALPAMSLQIMSNDDDVSDDVDNDNAKSTILSADFSNDELLSAIDRLPQHHKLVFNMYVMDKFSHKQIANELNISAGTSKSHLARARKKIQQFLYEDAMNKQKKKDRRRASVILLLFPAKEHYIDKLYRDKLSDFAIQPTGNADFLTKIAEHQSSSVASVGSVASTSVQTATFWGSKLSYMAFCGGASIITGTVCWFTMSVNSPLNNNNYLINSDIAVNDTLISNPTQSDDDAAIFDTAFYVENDTIILNGSNEALYDDINEELKVKSNIAVKHINKGVNAANKNVDDTDNNDKNKAIYGKNDKTIPVSSDSELDEENKEQIVIKKQIIQHQTVVIRDTIYINE